MTRLPASACWGQMPSNSASQTCLWVLWKHRLWFHRWNICLICSSRSVPAPRAVHGTWWPLSGWMRANQRTEMNSSVLAQVLIFSLLQVSSHQRINALRSLPPPPTSEDRCNTGPLPASLEAASQLYGHKLFTWHWSRRMVSWVKTISIWRTNPDFLGRKNLRGMGRGEARSWTRLHSMTIHRPSPGFTNKRAACLNGSQGLEWISGELGRSPATFLFPFWSLHQWFWDRRT